MQIPHPSIVPMCSKIRRTSMLNLVYWPSQSHNPRLLLLRRVGLCLLSFGSDINYTMGLQSPNQGERRLFIGYVPAYVWDKSAFDSRYAYFRYEHWLILLIMAQLSRLQHHDGYLRHLHPQRTYQEPLPGVASITVSKHQLVCIPLILPLSSTSILSICALPCPAPNVQHTYVTSN